MIVAVVSTGDLLSAESLILAVVSGVLALWYGEIQSALRVEKKLRVEDRGPEIKTMTRGLWRRAIPLTLLALAATGLFAPNSIQLVRRIEPLFRGDMPPYDPIAVSVVGVNIGMALARCTRPDWRLLLLLAVGPFAGRESEAGSSDRHTRCSAGDLRSPLRFGHFQRLSSGEASRG